MRLIDAEDIPYTMLYKENWINGTGKEAQGAWKSDIDKMRTIDAIPVVRCKDCIYWQDQKEGVVEVPICKYDCRGNKKGVVIVMGADDYCSHGEKREDGVDR